MVILIAAAVGSALYGWMIMLAFGILHSVIPAVPAIGFDPSWGLGLITLVIVILTWIVWDLTDDTLNGKVK